MALGSIILVDKDLLDVVSPLLRALVSRAISHTSAAMEWVFRIIPAMVNVCRKKSYIKNGVSDPIMNGESGYSPCHAVDYRCCLWF